MVIYIVIPIGIMVMQTLKMIFLMVCSQPFNFIQVLLEGIIYVYVALLLCFVSLYVRVPEKDTESLR